MDIPFPSSLYSILYVDPPWKYGSRVLLGNKVTRGTAYFHYPCMSHRELAALPVRELAEPDCLMFMWTTSPMMGDAIALGKQWGFQYMAVAFVWHKERKMVGAYAMSSCEFCLVFKRGRIPSPRGGMSELQFLSEIERCGRHSAKPAEVRARIERMFPGHNKLELFARERFEGWDAWGTVNEYSPSLPPPLKP